MVSFEPYKRIFFLDQKTSKLTVENPKENVILQ